MTVKDRLAKYRAKRHRSRTPEPYDSGGRRGGGPIFVLQRHAAGTLHFDFRLEIGGVLVSWSIPKGPSLNPSERRLGIRTEDHPMEYARFEGRIPKGEYGAWTVIVWDIGAYELLNDEPAEKALAAGHLKVRLHGERLSGDFSLIRTGIDGQEQWLLIKKNDEAADRRRKPAKTQRESVLTGRTNKDLE